MTINTPPDNVKEGIEDGTAFITRRCEFYEYDGETRWYPEGPGRTDSPSRMGADASVTIDATRDERRTFEALFDNRDALMDANPFGGFWYDKVIKPFKGVLLQDGTVWEIQVGEFLIDGIDDQHFPNQVRVSCRDYTKRMMLSKFRNSASFPASTNLGTFVDSLASNAGIKKKRIPSGTPSIGVDYQVEVGFTRWQAVKDVSLSKGYEIYFDNEGYLVLTKLPDPAYDPVEITFKTGAEGNLSSYNKKVNDSEVYNHIVVIGERETDSGGLPYFGEATNTDPESPTSSARIGHRMKDPITLSTLASDAEATTLARNLLKVSGLESFTLDAASISYPWIEANIVAEVKADRLSEYDPTRYLLDSISLPLGPGPMSWSCKRITIVSGSVDAPTPVPQPQPPVITPPETGTPTTNPEPSPEPTTTVGKNVDVAIATYNMGSGKDAGVISGLELLARRGADIICTQEGRNRQSAFASFLRRNPGWTGYLGPNGDSRAIAIFWRKSLGTTKRKDSYQWVNSRYLGPKGSPPSRIPSKRGSEVNIQLSNDRLVQVLNTHMIPSATKSRKTLGTDEYNRRRNHFSDQVGKLCQAIDARNGLVFTTGDYNAEPGFSLLQPLMNRVTMDHSFDTRMGRRIDYVTHRPHSAITVIDRLKVATTSDHDAVIVTFRIKGA